MTAAATSAFKPRGGVLARRNPTVKLALLFVVSLAMVFIFDPGYAGGPLRPGPGRHQCFHAPARNHGPGARSLPRLRAGDLPGQHAQPTRSHPVGGRAPAGHRRRTIGGWFLALRTLVIGILAIGFIASTDGVSLMGSFINMPGSAPGSPMPSWPATACCRRCRGSGRPSGRPTPSGRSSVLTALSPVACPPTAVPAFALLVVSVRQGQQNSHPLQSPGLGLTTRTTSTESLHNTRLADQVQSSPAHAGQESLPEPSSSGFGKLMMHFSADRLVFHGGNGGTHTPPIVNLAALHSWQQWLTTSFIWTLSRTLEASCFRHAVLPNALAIQRGQHEQSHHQHGHGSKATMYTGTFRLPWLVTSPVAALGFSSNHLHHVSPPSTMTPRSSIDWTTLQQPGDLGCQRHLPQPRTQRPRLQPWIPSAPPKSEIWCDAADR